MKSSIIRFFIGLGFGVLLTAGSLAAMGVGHGTYVPMVFTGSGLVLLMGNDITVAIVLSPFLWASYFLLIPLITRRWLRISLAAVVSSIHLLSGLTLLIFDSLLHGSLKDLLAVMAFGLLMATAIVFLFYFSARGSKHISAKSFRKA